MTKTGSSSFALALHGGAGTLRRGDMDAAREAGYRAGLRRALIAGRDILADGGGALDAVTASVCALEDDARCSTRAGARSLPRLGRRRWTPR